MSIKLVLLNNSEYIISDVYCANGTTDNGSKVVTCYVLKNPRSVGITDISFEPDNNNMNSTVQLFSWPKFTQADMIEVPPTSVVTITDPSKDLMKLYYNSLPGTMEKDTPQNIANLMIKTVIENYDPKDVSIEVAVSRDLSSVLRVMMAQLKDSEMVFDAEIKEIVEELEKIQ